MTVAELIEKLKTHDPSDKVLAIGFDASLTEAQFEIEDVRLVDETQHWKNPLSGTTIQERWRHVALVGG
jgi:hypothetical protein